ncbi:hypothetical protein CR513_03496, partial [Mucuna pruriens]
MVVLNTQKCECGTFQALRYLSLHVIVAYAHFVDISYSIKNIANAYSRQRESQHRQKYGYCKRKGHNQSNCPHILKDHGLVDESQNV